MRIGTASYCAFGEGFRIPQDEYLFSDDEKVEGIVDPHYIWERVSALHRVRFTLDYVLRETCKTIGDV